MQQSIFINTDVYQPASCNKAKQVGNIKKVIAYVTIALTVWLTMLIMSLLILAGYSENKVTYKTNLKTDSGNQAELKI